MSTEPLTYPFDPDYVVHPGASLAEWFEYTNFPTWKLYGIPDKETLDGILDGTLELTPELAQSLANFTMVPATFWLALEHNFRVGLAAGKHWSGSPVDKDS